MFLYRFLYCELSFLHSGTLISRFKECVALAGISYLTDLLGMTAPDAVTWIFDLLVVTDSKKMYESEDEGENELSYLP